MKRVLLVRHGQTKWNDEGRIQGWSHIGLNEVGRAQAREVAQYLATEHASIDAIHSSDLPRALETAGEIASMDPFEDVPMLTDAVWRERDFGVYQGFNAQEFFEKYPEFAVLSGGNEAANNRPERGESYAEFDRRVCDAWHDFLRTAPEQNPCLVTHTGVIRQILASIQQVDYVTAIMDIPLTNCSVTEVLYDEEEDKQTISASNQCHFLEDESARPSR